MFQEVIVGLIVAAAALYAAWRWMPAQWRRAAAARLAAGSQGVGLVDEAQAAELAVKLAQSGGCGACASCGGCAAKQQLTRPSADDAVTAS